jgi:glutaredoxin 3
MNNEWKAAEGQKTEMLNLSERVRIYTRPDCQYCDYAKELLTDEGIKFDERSVMIVEAGKEPRQDFMLTGWLAWATGQRTLPQIFIDGYPVGGFADLMTIQATGELKRRLAAPPPSRE